MRYSKASVRMFHLGRLVDGVASGELGIPEFQRDFDWSETDIRSLLATVFSGWPAGSLLFLEGDSGFFLLRPIEKAPELEGTQYAILDGQQRLTALYQALHAKGDMMFAVKWDIPPDQELEDGIVSYRADEWAKYYETVAQQIQHRIIPLSVMKTPSHFFDWRDRVLEDLEDKAKAAILRKSITDLYTYRLSAFHDYEFPVVMLDRTIEPAAVARIFEKVNRTGLTLNAFDLMVAKTFEPGWNLRDKWTSARRDYRSLGEFLGEDGMPLLQAIALLKKDDLRQSSVLGLSKAQVHENWDAAVASAARVVDFLRASCGVIRKDWMPYPNLLPPFIALEVEGRISETPDIFAAWFWYSGFAGSYDAAANTRLVSHFKNVREGQEGGYRLEERRSVEFLSATRKNEKALWNAAACATVLYVEEQCGTLPPAIVEELDVATLFSADEVASASTMLTHPYDPDLEFRSVANAFLVPRRLSAVVRKAGALATIQICSDSEFGEYAAAQITTALNEPPSWNDYRADRTKWLALFALKHGVKNVRVSFPDPENDLTEIVDH